jgi:hypothetical protein
MCKTCPFRQEGFTEVRSLLSDRALTEATPICHSTGSSMVTLRRHKVFKKSHLCRGARDLQLQVFHRLGVIDAPTDEAWARTWAAMQGIDGRRMKRIR